ncbi:site-2 protease family protein [Saccharibacillus sp. CPCC 101409]|uniref:site-2 protease family protein n=1 Tax=Saccharibacillus sp. CPCC 101409 TaxID=3058041 RepID=UPI0026711DA8|nr:site-2 protease family protein [Saccharibacillus sp. CPCC 101409]MDO3411363.1 site-2 protease family protein [Saccharibacillus sp. CPCC 101409]
MFRKIVTPLIAAAAGFVIVWTAAGLAGSGSRGAAAAESAWNTAGAFGGWPLPAALVAAAMIAMTAILVHEIGHILGALAVRSRVTRLYWGPLIFLFKERRVRFTVKNKYFFGAMQTDIREYKDEAAFGRAIRAQRIVCMAGPAFSLATGLAAYASAAQLWSAAGLYGLLSAGIGLATLFSDGVQALLLGRRNCALASAWAMLIQGERLDGHKRAFLRGISVRYLRELADRPSPPKGRELHDLHLLYYVKLMREPEPEAASGAGAKRADNIAAAGRTPGDGPAADAAAAADVPADSPEAILTRELEESWPPPSNTAKMQRDAMLMVLGEEVVRLCEAGEREAAEALLQRLGGRANKPSPLLLKARAFSQDSAVLAGEYITTIRAMSGDMASFEAFARFEEERLRGCGLLF